jgi:hypothetical protein
MTDGLDVPEVSFTELDANGEDPPDATLELLFSAATIQYDPEKQLVQLPDEVDEETTIWYVPDELAAQLGHEA